MSCMLLFVISLVQEVAASFSNAFGGCNQLVDILCGLERREPADEKPPKAIKRMAAGKAKAKAKPAAKPKPAADVESGQAAEAAGGGGFLAVEAAEGHTRSSALSGTRKCVTSRAYHRAKRAAKTAGKTAAEQVAAAQHAHKAAGETWDQEHA